MCARCETLRSLRRHDCYSAARPFPYEVGPHPSPWCIFYAWVVGGHKFFFLRDVSIKYVMHDILYRMQHLSLQERAAFSATVCLRRCGKIVMHILMRSRDGVWAQYITHLAGNRVRSLRNLTLFATSRLLFCSSPVSVWGWSAPFTLMHFLCMGGGWA